MKLLFLADINSSHTRKWVFGLVGQGLQIAVFSMSEPKEDWYSELGVTCDFHGADAGLQTKQSAAAKLSYLKAVKEVKKLYARIKPDIVHAHYATSYGLLGALLKAKNFIVSVWGSDVQDFPYRSIVHKTVLKFIFSRAKVVCSTSKSMLKDIDYVGAKRKVQIPFGIDLKEFGQKKHAEKDVITFGTIKTLDPVYGVDILIDAFSLYIKTTNRKDRLVIYGRGVDTEKLKQKTIDLGLEQLIDIKGYVIRKELPEAFLTLDVYLSLSRRESYGVAALEASACRLPVITSEAAGFLEVVKESETGYRVSIENLDGIVDRMISLQRTELREKLGGAGRKMVEEEFDFRNDVLKQIELYKNVVEI